MGGAAQRHRLMRRPPEEICEDKYCEQDEDNTGAARCEAASNESQDETTVRDEGECERNDENSAVILARQRDRLKNKRKNSQWHSRSEQPTNAL